MLSLKRILKRPPQKEDPQSDLFVVKKSTRAKRIALRLDTSKRMFTLVVPKGVPMDRALRFAEKYDGWMQEKLENLPVRIPFEDGEIIPILGVRRKLVIKSDPRILRTRITLAPRTLYVVTGLEDPSGRILRYLKELAQQHLAELSIEKASRIRKKVRSVSVRDTRTRWGSCAVDGSISYSWRLILAPLEAMDYVVAHEVAHLAHHDHSANFWSVCRKLSDNYLEGRYWMDNHGHDLMRYG